MIKESRGLPQEAISAPNGLASASTPVKFEEPELAAAEEAVRAHNRAVDDLQAAFLEGEEKVVEDYFTHVLDRALSMSRWTS